MLSITQHLVPQVLFEPWCPFGNQFSYNWSIPLSGVVAASGCLPEHCLFHWCLDEFTGHRAKPPLWNESSDGLGGRMVGLQVFCEGALSRDLWMSQWARCVRPFLLETEAIQWLHPRCNAKMVDGNPCSVFWSFTAFSCSGISKLQDLWL